MLPIQIDLICDRSDDRWIGWVVFHHVGELMGYLRLSPMTLLMVRALTRPQPSFYPILESP
jgi:hypothetical protein